MSGYKNSDELSDGRIEEIKEAFARLASPLQDSELKKNVYGFVNSAIQNLLDSYVSQTVINYVEATGKANYYKCLLETIIEEFPDELSIQLERCIRMSLFIMDEEHTNEEFKTKKASIIAEELGDLLSQLNIRNYTKVLTLIKRKEINIDEAAKLMNLKRTTMEKLVELTKNAVDKADNRSD